jgi:hypothetical protein
MQQFILKYLKAVFKSYEKSIYCICDMRAAICDINKIGEKCRSTYTQFRDQLHMHFTLTIKIMSKPKKVHCNKSHVGMRQSPMLRTKAQNQTTWE